MRTSGQLRCIDWEAAEVELWGQDSMNSYSGVDILATPCHMGMPIARGSGGEYIEPPDYCDWDQEKGLSYMDRGLNIVVISNSITFQQNEYGEDSILRVSTIDTQFVDGRRPNWINQAVQTTELTDNSELFQLDDVEEATLTLQKT